MMLDKVIENYCYLPQWSSGPLWKLLHRYLDYKDSDGIITFLNYGFADLKTNDGKIKLENSDEPNRYCIQLYHHIVSSIKLKGLDILEVGCGRGGGASYIVRYLKPKSYIGLDKSKKCTKFCNAFYKGTYPFFVTGDAEHLCFDNNSFDVIINVESSRCYRNMDCFLFEAYRVLRPSGYFLFGDMRTKDKGDILMEQLRTVKMKVIDLTPSRRSAINTILQKNGSDRSRKRP